MSSTPTSWAGRLRVALPQMSSLHQHAKDLFLEALARPPQDRDAFLADACGTDVALRQEVDSLLAFHSEHDDDSGTFDLLTRSDPPEDTFSPGEVFADR